MGVAMRSIAGIKKQFPFFALANSHSAQSQALTRIELDCERLL
jgi:hypothetical protein